MAASNRVCKSWIQYYLLSLLSFIIFFPFYVFYFFAFNVFSFFSFYVFYFFWGQQGCFPRSHISSGAMRKSDLRSSLSLKLCWLNHFYLFWKIDFSCEQKSFKALDLETIFWFFFEKRRVSLRRWTLNVLLKFDRWESLRHWTLNVLLIFERRESLRCWTLKWSLDFLMKWRSLWVGFYLVLVHWSSILFIENYFSHCLIDLYSSYNKNVLWV